MVAFYKRDIMAWQEGTASLTDAEYRLYDVILGQIYLHEGAIAPHERWLSGLANMHWRTFRRAFDALIKRGKLRVLEDGKVTNGRADAELLEVSLNRQRASKGGSASGQTRARLRSERAQTKENESKINGNDEAPLRSATNRLEKTRQERKKDAVPSGTALNFIADNPEAELFRRGKQVLGQNAGGLIKSLLASKDGSVPLARAAIEQAATKQDPREYVGGVIRGGAQHTLYGVERW